MSEQRFPLSERQLQIITASQSKMNQLQSIFNDERRKMDEIIGLILEFVGATSTPSTIISIDPKTNELVLTTEDGPAEPVSSDLEMESE